MRYRETREQSAELLRMVLPLMAKHTAGFNPMSYAVWYEFAAGINPALRAAIEPRLASGETFSDDTIAGLYAAHVAHRDIESTARMRTDIKRLMEDVDVAASEAGQEVAQFGADLAGYSNRLEQGIGEGALGGIVRSLLVDTTRMRAKTDMFQEHLQKSTREVERLREELEIAQGLAQRDPLTGLLNRRGFDQRAAQLGREGPGDGCLLMLDIDNFKQINDTHGHLLGDKVLVVIGNVLRSCVGERGSIARIGGEEFAVLLGQATLAEAVELAERVRLGVERGRLRRADGEEIMGGVTVSIGVARGHRGEALEAFVARADRALYASKDAGRNRVTVAPAPELQPSS